MTTTKTWRKPFTAADVTFYVPCYNDHDTVGNAVKSIRTQSCRPARILVVDDGSRTPLPAFGHPVETVRHERNQGLASARNTALQLCDTSLIAGIDADVAATPNWLERTLECLNALRVTGVGGRLNERIADSLADQWRIAHLTQHWGDQPRANPKLLYGANTLFKTRALRDAGGYDVRLRTHDDDRVMCRALYDAGHTLVYTPDAVAHHLRRDTPMSLLHSYWGWHSAKGIINGDFESTAGILGRIEVVNFGIFRYRRYLDDTAGRSQFLALDFLIPWVFSAKDLALFHENTGLPTPRLRCDELTAEISDDAMAVMRHIVPDAGFRSSASEDWHLQYIKEFHRCLRVNNWFEESRYLSWRPLLADATQKNSTFADKTRCHR